ncbi:hypothetical protein [Olsenella uli]|uniref:hypothetical protein n=1 Tax=Olsenella uli TaxID=133926 RepID=UPI003D78F358
MEMTSMPSEQHLPYRSTADVVVLDGDGSRWVRRRTCRVVERKHSWSCDYILLSCGHSVPWPFGETPCHCPECGAELIDDA